MEKPKSKRGGGRIENPGPISTKSDYLLVQPERFDFLEISYLVKSLFARKDFPEKNDIWVLTDVPLDITLGELWELKEFSERNAPPGFVGHKTAIVAEDRIHRAIVRIYDVMTASLPVKFRAFSSLEEAEKWVQS